MDGPNWGKLVEQGRAKAIGVAWSDEELKALYELKLPVEEVRRGRLTSSPVDLEEKPLRYMRKDELLAKAQSLGLSGQEKATRSELILLIKRKLNK